MRPLTESNYKWIYVIGADTGPLKIGITNSLAGRLSALQTSSHAKLHLIESFKLKANLANIVERDVHKRLAKVRLSGEWFAVAPIEACQTVRESIPHCETKHKEALCGDAARSKAKQHDTFRQNSSPPESPKLEVFITDAEIVRRISVSEYERVKYEQNAPKRALVQRLAEGKKRKAQERRDAAALNSWLSHAANQPAQQ